MTQIISLPGISGAYVSCRLRPRATSGHRRQLGVVIDRRDLWAERLRSVAAEDEVAEAPSQDEPDSQDEGEGEVSDEQEPHEAEDKYPAEDDDYADEDQDEMDQVAEDEPAPARSDRSE